MVWMLTPVSTIWRRNVGPEGPQFSRSSKTSLNHFTFYCIGYIKISIQTKLLHIITQCRTCVLGLEQFTNTLSVQSNSICRNIKVGISVLLVALCCDAAGLHQYQSQAESHHCYSHNKGDLRQDLPILTTCICWHFTVQQNFRQQLAQAYKREVRFQR